MAVNVVRVRSRDKRNRAKAQKAKREKLVLAVCVVILLALVGFEGPKTLRTLRGSSTTSTPPTPAAPADSAAPGNAPGTVATHPGSTLSRIAKFPAKDPFVQQLGASSGTPAETSPAAPPLVRTSHFVAKDPFVQQLTLEQSTGTTAASPATDVRPRHQGEVAGNGHYIIVLASVPLADGKPNADEAAAAARKAGVARIGVVNSSSYPTLRTGFYAVYSGPYPTLGALASALQQVRGQGYPSAYTRRLAR
jgi:hypothetical protein